LRQENKQQVLALGRLGWSLRRIQEATSVRRETASHYLKEAGIALRGPRQRRPPAPSSRAPTPDPKPANEPQVTTDFGGGLEAAAASPPPGRSPTASACEAHREAIERGLSRGRNAMQTELPHRQVPRPQSKLGGALFTSRPEKKWSKTLDFADKWHCFSSLEVKWRTGPRLDRTAPS